MDEKQKAFDAFEKTGVVSVQAGIDADTHGTWGEYAREWVALKQAAEVAARRTAAETAEKPPKPTGR